MKKFMRPRPADPCARAVRAPALPGRLGRGRRAGGALARGAGRGGRRRAVPRRRRAGAHARAAGARGPAAELPRRRRLPRPLPLPLLGVRRVARRARGRPAARPRRAPAGQPRRARRLHAAAAREGVRQAARRLRAPARRRRCRRAAGAHGRRGAVLRAAAPAARAAAAVLQVLLAAVPRSTLLLAGAAADGGGLLARQAYCVTGLARVRGAPDDCAVLLRLRAPGARGEWTGAWARDSPQRRALPAADRELLERRAAAPGTFWMPLGDFARAFARLELAHVGPDDWLREPALHAKRPWRAVLARRRWRRGVSAGGPPGAPTAHANPHFVLRVPPADGPCHVVVSVAQERARRPLGVGFAVYALADDAAPRRARPPQRALDVTHCSRAPEVATFFTLPPGQYLVVPHAHRAHAEAAFLLRVLTDERTDVWELNDDNALQAPDAAGAAEPAVRAAAAALAGADAARELDAAALRARLRRVWRRVLPARPSAELCRALVALCDGALGGRARAGELAALAARLALWRAALRSLGARRRLSSYRLRELLAACGASASNKVLEALVLRYARGAALDADACMVALARLHLAHERFRSLDSKLKSNPLSLEEVRRTHDPDDNLLMTSRGRRTKGEDEPQGRTSRRGGRAAGEDEPQGRTSRRGGRAAGEDEPQGRTSRRRGRAAGEDEPQGRTSRRRGRAAGEDEPQKVI
ncbi:calpain-1 catalytic subunit-like isoform X2 [Bicyclus anynana]|uniref:Calpain-1 catalytic subunit-like isoform X2 n=1 Tax=Bicyclus anynana TaxID=110368 RepID=A0ABM3LWT2_BICAN|nr:calpain-1 catalytic subunit-like isoform X2 [Bicyclus anynana]XP_052743534.1 calpain-1 catalytic subunit-like isoform X2 [Bicyclus anynana]